MYLEKDMLNMHTKIFVDCNIQPVKPAELQTLPAQLKQGI